MEIEEILISKDIKFIKQGSDYLTKCLNPDHEDNNPSMRIDVYTGMFHCFSCSFKGNIFTHFGAKISKVEQKIMLLKKKIETMQKPTIYELPKDMELYNKDYRGISGPTLNKYGAFTTYSSEELKDRIIFPIKNLSSEVVGIIGRYIHSNAKPKYLVRPHKVQLPLFPALPKPINGAVILVEGLFDALNLIDKGMGNVVCTFGTSTISKNSVDRLLGHYRVLEIDTIYTMFDNDAAGHKATETVSSILKNKGFTTDVIEISGDYKDPGELPKEVVSQMVEYFYENSNS